MKRVTLREIAAAADVSVMAVSLALRDQGRLAPGTRRKIKRHAAKLGYRPDPALSALMTYRYEQQTVRDYRTLAFVTNYATAGGWKQDVFTRCYFEGASARAEKLGYRVEPFWMSQPKLTPARAAQILQSRGIKGLLVAPVPAAVGRLVLAWDRFCAVSLCRNLASPDINVVDHNHYQSMTLAWRELRRRGYRRIGYAVTRYSEEIAGRMWEATLRIKQQYLEPGEHAVPPLITDDWNRANFDAWLAQHKPDVVISPRHEVLDWLKKRGFAVPAQIGFLWLEAEESRDITGVCQHFANVGEAAVDLLHLELMRSAYGIPVVRQTIGIDGYWREGKTLRPPPAV